MATLTPMLKQYFDIKKQYEDCILFFRMGDFYEVFGQDAKKTSSILEITLTARNKGKETEIPMCGVPHHAVNNYLSKLTKTGKKVAICDQISDPKLPGLVERKVTRIVTPGTTFDENILDNKINNYLCSIVFENNLFGLCFVDLTTGEFNTAEFTYWKNILTELKRIEPNEIIITKVLSSDYKRLKDLQSIGAVNEFEIDAYKDPYEILCEHFKVKSLQGFGIEGLKIAIKASGIGLSYLQETQKVNLDHINSISVYNSADYMVLDETTLRNLDVLYNSFDGTSNGSLLSILDKTKTAMGGRLLRNWLLRPLINKSSIESRYDGVGYFKKKYGISEDLKAMLKSIGDIERLIGRIGCGRTNARDLLVLKTSLEFIPQIKDLLFNTDCLLLKDIIQQLDLCEDVVSLILQSIHDEPPVVVSEGGMIRDGYNQELDELRSISSSGKDYIKNLQVQEIEKTGITTLKVKFNKVFGYYIEISKSYLDQVPDYYIRKQTLVNAERFIIPELKEYEEKVLAAQDKIIQIEQELFLEIINQIRPYFETIQKNAKLIATLDVLLNFANIAIQNNYERPNINEQGQVNIKQGRHPVIEKSDIVSDFIPNDTTLNHEDHQLILLTGPNMAGKSSFLRQTALIVLLAQIGCFVPCESADISICDRIFTRVGAADNLLRGQSTFMVEMQEAANIIHNATPKSLIILDELGRGTSTYDGLSIAWAITEYIYNKVGSKTLFATHYHELIEVIDQMPKAQNYAMAVKEHDGKVLFLHTVIKGGSNRSYGIEVAKLAGMPESVVQKAEEYLFKLETKKVDNSSQATFDFHKSQNRNEERGKGNEGIINKVIKCIEDLDLENMSPIEVFKKMEEIKKGLLNRE